MLSAPQSHGQAPNAARVYFESGQYAAVSADNVFEAVAQAISGARCLLRSLKVTHVELDVTQRYLTEPDYV